MYTIYSTFALSLFLCIAFGIRLRSMGKLSLSGLGDGALLTFVLTIVSLVVSAYISNYIPEKEVTYGPFPLASARTNDGINGAFVWGSGSIESQAVYHILVRNDNGSSTPYTIDADNRVAIFEDSPSEHEGTWTIVKREKDWTAPVAKWALGKAVDRPVTIKQELHVPKGTIVENFSLQ